MLTRRLFSNLLGASCRHLLLVVLLLASSPALAAEKMKNKSSNRKADDEIMNIFKMMKILMGRQEYDVIATTDEADMTPLLVIGAGFGRTGTTSYMAALEHLGLQSYHMKAVLGTPGHIDMWIEYLTEKQKGDGKVSQEQVNKLVHGLAAAGFHATASMPACFAFQDLMEHYPNARVVVTVRGDGNGEAWATSILNSVAGMLPAMKRIPFRWIPSMKRFTKLLPLVWQELGIPINATTSRPERNDLARAYDAWLEHIQSVVPSDKLLLFAPQNGWQPLCEFLSPVDPKIEMACQEILELGESYPRANESARVQDMLKIVSAISWTFEHAHYFVVLLICIVFLVKQSKRRRAVAVVDSNKKKKV
jgi:Sulfotransferase domain